MADVATGATIVFGTSGFTAQVLSIAWDGMDRESVQISHLGTTNWHDFMPVDLTDPGSVTMGIQLDPDDTPPVLLAAEVITVTFPLPAGGTTPADWEATGFSTSFSMTAELETVMEGTLVLKMTGAIVFTAGT